ncbi:hypothetical protein AB0F42_09600 [Streptomyces buecherae]|uniref:hypothetical protein n=1 Tax=Streptomyces buecherae TaxID=2763006 RepID=UPI0033EB0835
MNREEVRELVNLVRFEGEDIAALIERARTVSAGLIEEVVYLTRADAADILIKFLAGEFSADDFSEWAEAVHGLDTIGAEEGYDDLLIQFIFEISTPELFCEVNEETGKYWLDEIKRSL